MLVISERHIQLGRKQKMLVHVDGQCRQTRWIMVELEGWRSWAGGAKVGNRKWGEGISRGGHWRCEAGKYWKMVVVQYSNIVENEVGKIKRIQIGDG